MSVVHTAVVARKIKRGRERDYEQWLMKVASALHSTAGYDGMTAISSPDPAGSVRTLLIRFVSATALADWENSDIRHALAADGNQFSTYYYQTAPGVETFFALPGSSLPAPPRWKMCVLTIPAVYVLVNVVLAVLARLIPGLAEWPVQLRMVPVTLIMTVLLTYVFLPGLSKLFAPWLFAHATPSTSQTFQPQKS